MDYRGRLDRWRERRDQEPDGFTSYLIGLLSGGMWIVVVFKVLEVLSY